jgi:hypothetical protein
MERYKLVTSNEFSEYFVPFMLALFPLTIRGRGFKSCRARQSLQRVAAMQPVFICARWPRHYL